MSELTGMQEAAAAIALFATTAMNLSMSDKVAALDSATAHYIADAADAAKRNGRWARQSTSEEIEAALFIGSVARDAVENTFRPSTGPMRDYILSLIH